MELGASNGWDMLPTEDGDWGWHAWSGANARSGVEPTEEQARAVAERELALLIDEAERQRQAERELFATDDDPVRWNPRA